MDLSTLCAPIPGDQPCGADLRLVDGDLTLQTVRDARTELLPEEDLSGSGGRSADWRAVIRECQEALTKRTKDLELANYLTEAWARTRGVEGLADGLELIDKLLGELWSTIHPGVDEDEIILPIRRRHLSWLGGASQFLQSVGAAELFRTRDGKSITIHARQQAEWLADVQMTQPDRYESLAEGKLTLDQLDAIVAAVPQEVLVAAKGSVRRALAQVATLQQTCDKLFADDESPTLIPLRDALEEAERFVTSRLTRDDAAEAVDAAAPIAGAQTAVGAGATARGPGGPIASRSDAMQRLREVADFFRRTEPHSPVSYLVARATRWAEMPLEGVLKEVVKDGNALDQIWELLGIKPPEEGQE
jgi:type VI secretion system protein ImpA